MIAPLGSAGAAPGFPRRLVVPGPAGRMLRKLPGTAGADVLAALTTYAATGAGNVRQLVNAHPPAFRLRVGDLRAVFRLAEVDGAPAVVVEWVGHRRDAY